MRGDLSNKARRETLFIGLFLSPSPPAHKEPGKPRANSLVTLGSQRSSGLFHKQVTVARQASLPGSPQPPRNPLLRQRRVGCYDTDDASDEEEFDGEGDCISLPGTLPAPSRPLTEVDSRHILMTSSKVTGINSRGEQPQKTVVSKASSVPLLGSSLDLEESVPEGLGDTPSRAANLLASAEAPRGGPGCSGRKELSGSKSSPKLEYKADTGTQSLGNTDPPRSAQQKNDSLGSRHKPVARVSPHHKRPEADARPSTSETVHLTAGADVPCVRATSSKETRTGFHPGGTAEKVTDLLFLTWDLSHYPVSEDGVCESITCLQEGQWLAASLAGGHTLPSTGCSGACLRISREVGARAQGSGHRSACRTMESRGKGGGRRAKSTGSAPLAGGGPRRQVLDPDRLPDLG